MEQLELKEYDRKSFTVVAVQVTLDNVNQVAEWCKGTVEKIPTRMMGTETLLPCIKIKGQGNNKGQVFTATLGCYVVELKGSFRVYKQNSFASSFDERKNRQDVSENQTQLELPEPARFESAI